MSRLNATVWQGAYLPYWTKEGATYAVRLRLVESLPQHILKEWRRGKETVIHRATHEMRSLSHTEKERLSELSSEKIEYYLRQGYGSCALQNKYIAAEVVRQLQQYDGIRYRLLSWCLMPNHVHIVVEPIGKWSLHEIIGRWKTNSARKANKILGKRGEKFWQEEYFDHLIRSEEGFRCAIEYTWNNPKL